jgi:hypothetical protein
MAPAKKIATPLPAALVKSWATFVCSLQCHHTPDASSSGKEITNFHIVVWLAPLALWQD